MTRATDEEAFARAQKLILMNQGFCQMVPHNRALGLQMTDFGDNWALVRLPWDPRLVGDPARGVLHGGVITTLIDATSGVSVFLTLPRPVPVATLDLRIDYLRPADPGRDVLARAECYKLTRNVAFVRAVAYHDDPADPIASSAGSFMLSTSGRSVVEAAEAAEAARVAVAAAAASADSPPETTAPDAAPGGAGGAGRPGGAPRP